MAFVRGLAATPDATHQLPDPAVIWWKAQLLRRWQAERAAAAPIERMRWIELASGLASLVAFLVWQWQGLVGLVANAIPAGIAAASAAPQSVSPMGVVLIACGHGVGWGPDPRGLSSTPGQHLILGAWDSGFGIIVG